MDDRQTCGGDVLMRGAMRGDDKVAQRFNNECSLETRRAVLSELNQRAQSNDGHTMQLGNLVIEGDLSHAKVSHLSKVAERSPVASASAPEAKPRAAAPVGDGWEYTTPEQQAQGRALTADLLKGKDITEPLNKLNAWDRRSVMQNIEHELYEKSAGNVSVDKSASGPEGIKTMLFKTNDGTKVLISETNIGSVQDIQVNAGRTWRNPLGGAVDVYDRPGETKDTGSSSGPSLIERLAGPGKLTDGNGPLAKAIRGEDLTADEQRQIEELAKKPGSKVQIYKPRDGGE